MLQRLQTICLLMVIIAMLAISFTPIWTSVDTTTYYTYTMYAWYFQELDPINNRLYKVFIPYIFIGILSVITTLIALYEISQYDNRIIQLKLGVLNSLIMTSIIGLIIYLPISIHNRTQVLSKMTEAHKLGFLLPAIALASNLIANRLIKKDEKLVRSIDSIR